MKKINFTAIALVVLIALITLFIRIPLPSRGYFSLGDVAVVFSGLVLANAHKKTILLSFFVAAVGSAMADIIGGFAIFAPLTFFAKGLESMFANLSLNKKPFLKYLFLSLSALAMLSVYFVFETLMPNIGLQLAVQEIIPNIIQSIGGIIGGMLTFAAYKKIRP